MPFTSINSIHENFMVLGLVELIDAKGIDVAQPIWLSGSLTKGLKQAKNTKNAFFACFKLYVEQPCQSKSKP